MGGGTGANVEFLGDRARDAGPRHHRRSVPVAAGDGRGADRQPAAGPTSIPPLADATTFDAGRAGRCDHVFLLADHDPNWFQALERAYALLKPGGMIGVVDFYIARKWPAAGHERTASFWRCFWPTWFGFDNVFLSPDHLPWLQGRFETVKLEERLGGCRTCSDCGCRTTSSWDGRGRMSTEAETGGIPRPAERGTDCGGLASSPSAWSCP